MLKKMKIASNKLCDLYRYYQNELHHLYSAEELYAQFELVCEAHLNYSKQEVKNHFQENVNQSELLKIYDACKELKKGIPIQYILKQTYFYDSFFYVTPAVLIPRPETEELVHLIIKDYRLQITDSELEIADSLNKNDANQSEIYNLKSEIFFLDIGTGSGCIPITLKKHIPHSIVSAIDISVDALDVARKNAINHQVEIQFIQQDVLNTISLNHNIQQLFDIIVSNPPYVLDSEKASMESHVLLHEPHLALFVEDTDPIIFYKRIIDFCQNNLKPKGFLYFELNPLHAKTVYNYAIESKLFTFTEILTDISGKQRFFKAQRYS